MAKELKSGMEFDGTTAIPDPNLEIGMDFDLWAKDRAGFRTSVKMVTGGVSAEFGSFAGPEVGEQFQGADGEERTDTCYVSSNAMDIIDGDTVGSMGREGAVMAGEFGNKSTTMTGKSTLRAPQNYRLFGTRQHR